MNNIRVSILACSLSLLVSACSLLSPTVSEAQLKDRAAVALNTTPDKVKVTDIRKEGVETMFVATVGSRSHRCSVTSANIMPGIGSNISGALCGGSGTVGKSTGKNTSCNDLLRAAGRC